MSPAPSRGLKPLLLSLLALTLFLRPTPRLRAQDDAAKRQAAEQRVRQAHSRLKDSDEKYHDALERKTDVSRDLQYHAMRSQTALLGIMRGINKDMAQSARAKFDSAAQAAKNADERAMSSAQDYLQAEEDYKAVAGKYLMPHEVENWNSRVAAGGREGSGDSPGTGAPEDVNSRLAKAARDVQNAKGIGGLMEQSKKLGNLSDDVMRQTLTKLGEADSGGQGGARSRPPSDLSFAGAGARGVDYAAGAPTGGAARFDPTRASVLISPPRNERGRSNPASSIYAAQDLVARGDRKNALRAVGELLAANPRDGRAWTLQSQLLNKMRRFGEAELAAKRALELDRSDAEALKSLIWAQLHQKKYEEALKNANELIRLNPEDGGAYLLRAFIYESMGLKNEMMRDLETAARYDPRYKNHLALAKSGLGLFDPDRDNDRLMDALDVEQVPGRRIPVFGLAVILISLSLGGVWLLWLSRREERKALSPRQEPASPGSAPAVLKEPAAAEPGSILASKYQLARMEHENSLCRMWCAHDLSLGRLALLKQMRPQPGEDPSAARAAYREEARVLATLHHPNVVDIYEFLDLPSGFYWVFELVPGKSLRRLLLSDKRLPLSQAVPLLRGAAEGLAAAHEAGILHRNLRPENILVTENGTAKLMEFSPASAPRATSHPAYLAPEAARGAASPASDIYSLGACLYEALFGEAPSSPLVPASARMPGLDPKVDALLEQSLRPDPALRLQSAKEFALRLR